MSLKISSSVFHMVLEYTKGNRLETQLKDTHKTQNIARAASAISELRTEKLISPLLPAS